ncbi:MAG: hypothetical protein USCGTAYLOR_02659 [Chromatiales bacterium USCg_Taylor]|nr:MAG: hypothetical protein USCGTAYLOR_02659 [Chromatiales bacterium USCg_Taylor]
MRAPQTELGAPEHRLVELVLQLVQPPEKVLESLRRNLADGLTRRDLRGDETLAVPDQEIIIAQALEHRIELDRIEIAEMSLQFLGAPARGLGAGADLPQDQEAHQHLVLAAAKKRDESVERLPRPKQRERAGRSPASTPGAKNSSSKDAAGRACGARELIKRSRIKARPWESAAPRPSRRPSSASERTRRPSQAALRTLAR